jgi:hypothetical protein
VLPSAATGATCSWLLHALAHFPYKPGELTSDRGQSLGPAEPGGEVSVAEVQAVLRSPGELDDVRRYTVLALFERSSNSWGVAGMVSCFTEHVSEQ